ncbi:YeeE/YedE family protein [Herbaspirillum sp. RV1423]|uniref:YeeE/YedE family protein n=1 Tax=Herbaspirillum sp. RV1423 TaxID=1443993 RepID=UPI0004B2C623|nr:YeeE/YedE family protein [Herbaspirillum sp. RV1423]
MEIDLIDFDHFTPGLSLAGGLMIGGAAAGLILFNGRIAGISGILGGLLKMPRKDTAWRAAFLIGLLAAPLIAAWSGVAVVLDVKAGWGEILAAGFIVGLGTRYAGGCTSGHGVCGLARGSLRSLVATLTFMVTGFLTVFVRLHVIGA